MIYKKEALWSILEINTNKEIDIEKIKEIYKIVDCFENKYSRFIKNNYLDKLNSAWTFYIDKEFKTLYNLCETLFKATQWYFDITIWPILEKLWYWFKNNKSDRKIWFENIKILWDEINLNWTNIEFWSVWKWYLIDKIYDLLKEKHDDLIINFGWDIKIWKYEKTIWLEDPYDIKKIIWSINIKEMAFCSSSWQKRKFWNSHHLINPKNKLPQNDKIAIYLTHKSACIADWFSTALFVTPIEKSLIILEKIEWLEWLIIAKNWEIYKTKGFNVTLF